jgi:hypothetical protein
MRPPLPLVNPMVITVSIENIYFRTTTEFKGHCPSGVAEPTTPPAVESSPTASSPEGTVTTAAPSQFTGAAVVGAKREGLGAMVLGAIGVFLI